MIGAGAAGSMAAIFAASAGAETHLLERTPDGGRKILISGGGRCNILPAALDESRFVTDSSPYTLRKILRSWPLREQVAFFERELGLTLVEEPETAKLFPASNRARDVRDGLLALVARRGGRILMSTLVTGITPAGPANAGGEAGPPDAGRDAASASGSPTASRSRPRAASRADSRSNPRPGSRARWRIERAGAPPLEADAVVVATGGLSVPKTGSDGIGLAILERLGHTLHPTYAALTPLIAEASPFAALAGVSLPVTLTARAGKRTATAEGGLLFTHRGYSGPAVLDTSHVAVRSLGAGEPRARFLVRWTRLDEAAWEEALRTDGARSVASALRRELPERLALALLEIAGVDPARSLAQLRRDERLRLVETLVRGTLPWSGHEGYKKAEVTGGGVSLAEIDPQTMESRKHPGLFICGEALDAFGPIGGYNFFWAWATGRAAGLASARE